MAQSTKRKKTWLWTKKSAKIKESDETEILHPQNIISSDVHQEIVGLESFLWTSPISEFPIWSLSWEFLERIFQWKGFFHSFGGEILWAFMSVFFSVWVDKLWPEGSKKFRCYVWRLMLQSFKCKNRFLL